jgi:NitT/TauT family transport system substrate-binding protein
MKYPRQLLYLVLLFAVAGLRAESVAAKPDRIVLLVDEIKQIRSFPVVLAERLGYFAEDGVTVTVMNIRDDASSADMLMDGRVDAVMAYYHHTVVNQSEGRNFETIVALGMTPGAKVLVANRSKDKFKTTADLRGSRFISGGAGSSKTTLANYLVLAGGLKLGDYSRTGTDGREKNVATLREGKADFVVAPVPDGDFYEGEGVATVWADLTTVEGTKKYFGALFPSASVYMTTARVAAHPEIAQHLADAFVRTLHFINTHTPEEIAAVIPDEIAGKDRAAYLKVLRQEIPLFATDGRMPADAAEKEWRVLAEATPKFQTVKPGLTYTNVFAEAALRKYP